VIALELKTLPFAWMDVGDVGIALVQPISAPTTLPESGASLWLAVVALLGSGAVVTGLGARLRRRS
jgi:hypothetical protein